MSASNVEICRTSHEAFNRRDFDVLLNNLATDAVYHDHARGVTFRARDGYRQFLEGWVTAFSDAQVSEPSYVDAGDVIVSEFTARGTNDGVFGPLPATGRTISVPMCEIIRFNDQGQLVSAGLYYDQLSFLSQLGHAQVPGAAAGA